MISYWQQSAWFDRTDVAIIGGGIVGLSAAIHLKILEPALRVSLFEKGAIPAGATTRNAGFACFGSISELVDDLSNRSADEVWQLAKKRFDGLNLLRKITGDSAIQYDACGGYEVFRTEDEWEKYIRFIPEINHALHEFAGLENTFSIPRESADTFGFKNISGLIFNQHEGAIHSGKMAQALMEKARTFGVQLFYGFDVKEIHSDGNGAHIKFNAPELSLDCKAILACTNGFSKTFFPDLDIQPARGLVLVTEKIPALKIKGTFHHNKGYDYFREIDGRVLLGGGRNLDIVGETTTQEGTNPKINEYLLSLLNETILPDINYKIDYQWTGIMGLGGSKAPIMEEYEPNIFCAIRMGGMGIAIGSQVGADAADMVYRKFNS
jgi:gamma-glutamylputrescine oxidase